MKKIYCLLIIILIVSCAGKKEIVYKNTLITVHTNVNLDDKNNFIYCVTFQMAWDYLKNDYLQEDVRYNDLTADNLAQILNSSELSKDIINPDDCEVSVSEFKDPDDMPTDLKKRVGSKLLKEIDFGEENNIFIKSSIKKNLLFDIPFESFRKELLHFQNDPVYSFGFREDSDKKILDQIYICYYLTDDDFILKIKPNGNDEIYLAKIKPLPTLKETIAFTESKMNESMRINDYDSVIVPSINFKAIKIVSEFKDLYFKSPKFFNQRIAYAAQSIDYKLDNNGAKLESTADIGIAAAAVEDVDEKPVPVSKNLVLDKPFLLYAKESSAKKPYLAIWFNNTELFEK